MIVNISNDPILPGIKRKAGADLYWITTEKKKRVIINCVVRYYDDNDEEIVSTRFQPYSVQLVATEDTFVHPNTGIRLTEDELKEDPQPESITEYAYYANVLGGSPIIVPNVIAAVIAQRDVQHRFDI